MNLLELSSLIQDERKCLDYLRQVGVLKTFTTCTRCGSDKLGIIRRNRYKCYKCKTEWSPFRDSFLVTVNIDVAQFILAIKLFELEKSTYTVVNELKISQKTASKIYSYIRSCIAGELPSFITNKIIKDYAPLFRIVSHNHLIKIVISDDTSAHDEAFIIGTRRTDSGKNVFYDFSCRYKSDLKRSDKIMKNRSYEINRFWSFALDRLRLFNGTTVENYCLYLKELEFRFNNRSKDFYKSLMQQITQK